MVSLVVAADVANMNLLVLVAEMANETDSVVAADAAI